MKGSEVPCGIRPKSKQSVEIALTTVEIALNSVELDLNEVWNNGYNSTAVLTYKNVEYIQNMKYCKLGSKKIRSEDLNWSRSPPSQYSLLCAEEESKIYVSFFSSTSIICFHILIVRSLKKETSTRNFSI